MQMSVFFMQTFSASVAKVPDPYARILPLPWNTLGFRTLTLLSAHDLLWSFAGRPSPVNLSRLPLFFWDSWPTLYEDINHVFDASLAQFDQLRSRR